MAEKIAVLTPIPSATGLSCAPSAARFCLKRKGFSVLRLQDPLQGTYRELRTRFSTMFGNATTGLAVSTSGYRTKVIVVFCTKVIVVLAPKWRKPTQQA